MRPSRIVHASAVLPQEGPAILDGAVVLGDAGGVVDVGRAGAVLPRHAGLPVEVVHGVLAPGLVNAHTHLELSWMHGLVPGGGGFVGWVDRLVTLRSEESESAVEAGLGVALDALDASCTAGVGEVSNALAAEAALVARGLAGSVFHEVFGLLEGPLLERVTSMLASFRAPGDRLARAPAPHTLYTTHPSGVRALLSFARERGLVTSIHMAEHPAERLAIERAEGPVPGWFEERVRIPRAEQFFPREPLFDYAARLGVLGPDVLLVHMTDARPDELARARDAGSKVVLCPRSNVHIEGRLPDAAAMLALGLEPALGTDSLASAGSLDVLDDARLLASTGIGAADALRMATWNGARALGRLHLGRIAAGARPGLVVAPGAPGADPAASFLSAPERRWIPGTEPS